MNLGSVYEGLGLGWSLHEILREGPKQQASGASTGRSNRKRTGALFHSEQRMSDLKCLSQSFAAATCNFPQLSTLSRISCT